MHDTTDHKGYTITISRDDCPVNPFEDYDSEPPLLAFHGYRCETATGYNLDRIPPTLTRDQIKANAKDIAYAMDHRSLLRVVSRKYRFRLNYDTATDAINASIHEYIANITNTSDLTSILAQCWRWAGCTALDTCTIGYVQGAYADLLLVATPQWLDMTGIDATDTGLITQQLENAKELYGAWCWGDVYYCTVTDAAGEDIDITCGEFYGSDHEQSGLLDYARSGIDAHIARLRREHLAQLRVYIKNRVPLQVRQTQEHTA